jgi:clan AA aspartic protease (TIGR02281 family)
MNIYLYGRLTLSEVLTAQTQLTPASQQNRPANAAAPLQSSAKPQAKKLEQVQSEQADSIFNDASRLFNSFLFPEAVALYEELSLLDEPSAIKLKRLWHEQLKSWLQSRDFNSIDAFNDAFLTRFPYDLPFLELKAEALVAISRIPAAIELYFLLISYTFETRQEEYFAARIHHLAGEQIDTFKQGQLWQAIIDLTNVLLQQESNYPPYILAQAQAYIKIGEFNNAEPMLTALLDNKYYREQTQQLLNDIRNHELQQTAIHLQPMGEHYIVGGQINQSNPIRLMIDTGASISVLTRARFDEIQDWTNPQYIGETLLNTAGGQINAPIYQFDSFTIDEFEVRDMSFVIIDLADMTTYNGLLGMNFLKQFHFQIDQENKLLILSP